jgi:hypothetical protein
MAEKKIRKNSFPACIFWVFLRLFTLKSNSNIVANNKRGYINIKRKNL